MAVNGPEFPNVCKVIARLRSYLNAYTTTAEIYLKQRVYVDVWVVFVHLNGSKH